MSKPEPHVIITGDKIPNGKKVFGTITCSSYVYCKQDVWLKGRINKDTTDVLSLPELYMSIAKLSQLKQGHHEESPQATVSNTDDIYIYTYNYFIIHSKELVS